MSSTLIFFSFFLFLFCSFYLFLTYSLYSIFLTPLVFMVSNLIRFIFFFSSCLFSISRIHRHWIHMCAFVYKKILYFFKTFQQWHNNNYESTRELFNQHMLNSMVFFSLFERNFFFLLLLLKFPSYFPNLNSKYFVLMLCFSFIEMR